MKAFLTGSRAYGTPRPDSDIDLVVRVDQATKTLLEAHSDTTADAIRFGTLNLITVTNDAQYNAWKKATEGMVKEGRPFDREEARARIIAELEKLGQKDEGGSGDGSGYKILELRKDGTPF